MTKHIGNSPLTNTIYLGTLIRNGTMWGANKVEVTMMAMGAVAESVHGRGGSVQINDNNGKKLFTIQVSMFDEDGNEVIKEK